MKPTTSHLFRQLIIPVAACLAGGALLTLAVFIALRAIDSDANWAKFIPPTVLIGGAFAALGWGGKAIHEYLKSQPDGTTRVAVPSPGQITVVDDKGQSWQMFLPPIKDWTQEELLECFRTGKVPESVQKRGLPTIRK